MSVPGTTAASDQLTVGPSEPLVSVIVPTRNRAKLSARGVEGVLAGCGDVDVDVIYVDDSSTDDTGAVLAEYAKAGKIRQVQTRSGAPGRARNAGAAIAKGHYLLFTDDDCLVPPGWVAADAQGP